MGWKHLIGPFGVQRRGSGRPETWPPASFGRARATAMGAGASLRHRASGSGTRPSWPRPDRNPRRRGGRGNVRKDAAPQDRLLSLVPWPIRFGRASAATWMAPVFDPGGCRNMHPPHTTASEAGEDLPALGDDARDTQDASRAWRLGCCPRDARKGGGPIALDPRRPSTAPEGRQGRPLWPSASGTNVVWPARAGKGIRAVDRFRSFTLGRLGAPMRLLRNGRSAGRAHCNLLGRVECPAACGRQNGFPSCFLREPCRVNIYRAVSVVGHGYNRSSGPGGADQNPGRTRSEVTTPCRLCQAPGPS